MRSNSKIKSKEILINILTGKSYTVKELDKIHYIQKDLRYLKRASIISTTIGKTKKRVLRYKLINKAQLNEYIEYEYGNIIKHTDGEYTKAAAAKETGNAHSGKSHNSQFFQLIAFNNIDLLNQRNNKVINASSLWAEHKISCCVTGSTACDIRIKKEKVNMITVENIECFYSIKRIFPKVDIAIFSAGTPYGLIGEWFNLNKDRINTCMHWGDFDVSCLQHYESIKKQYNDIQLYVPDDIESIFEKYHCANNYLKQLKLMTNYTPIDLNCKKIIDCIRKYKKTIQQEVML